MVSAKEQTGELEHWDDKTSIIKHTDKSMANTEQRVTNLEDTMRRSNVHLNGLLEEKMRP